MRFFMPIGFLAVAAGFSAAVMLLWNWLIPVIFGLPAICFWQAVGLLVLCRILFGGFGWKYHFGKKHHHHNQIREKWLKMTPEERKEFMKHRRFGCGFGGDFFQNESKKQD